MLGQFPAHGTHGKTCFYSNSRVAFKQVDTHTGGVDGTATAGLPLRLLLLLLLGLLLLRLGHWRNSDSSLLDRHGDVA